MFWDGHWGWGGWLVMTLGMLAFWGLVAWAVVSVVRTGRSQPRSQSAEEVLDERYARGDIDDEEYRRRRDVLRGR